MPVLDIVQALISLREDVCRESTTSGNWSVYGGDMDQNRAGKLNVRFVLTPDRQVLERLLPIVAGLGLAPLVENEVAKDTVEETPDLDTSLN